MANVIIRQKVNVEKLTQHERVVFARAHRMGMTVQQYAKKFGSKNIDGLLDKLK